MSEQQLSKQIENLQRQISRLQQMASLGELVGTTTHEFNNYLMTIINYAKIGMRHKDEESRDRAFQKIHDAGKGVVGMKILGEGTFAEDEKKKDQSIRYVFTLGCIDTLAVGFETPPQIDDFASRVKKVPGKIT